METLTTGLTTSHCKRGTCANNGLAAMCCPPHKNISTGGKIHLTFLAAARQAQAFVPHLSSEVKTAREMSAPDREGEKAEEEESTLGPSEKDAFGHRGGGGKQPTLRGNRCTGKPQP